MRSLHLAVLTLGLALPGCGDDDRHEDCDDLLDCLAIDLRGAMAVAVEHEPGVVIDAELSDEDGDGAVYDVDIYTGTETREISVDARTGKFVRDGFDPEDQSDGPDQAATIASSKSMITLPIAVATAEADAEGIAVSAELDIGARAIEVVLFQGDQRSVVTIDLDDGSVRERDEQGG